METGRLTMIGGRSRLFEAGRRKNPYSSVENMAAFFRVLAGSAMDQGIILLVGFYIRFGIGPFLFIGCEQGDRVNTQLLSDRTDLDQGKNEK